MPEHSKKLLRNKPEEWDVRVLSLNDVFGALAFFQKSYKIRALVPIAP
jgi:hypothetical protein